MSVQDYTKEIVTRYGSMLLSKKQAAHELQISECQLDRMRKNGELKFTKVGSQIRIPASVIADFMV